jgi:hypothetical protein
MFLCWPFTFWANHFPRKLDFELAAFETEKEQSRYISTLYIFDKLLLRVWLHLSDICRRKWHLSTQRSRPSLDGLVARNELH